MSYKLFYLILQFLFFLGSYVFSNTLPPSMMEDARIKQFIAKEFDHRGQNWGIHQNPISGKVYFANSRGLYEFNGIEFKLYSLPGNEGVRSVYGDNEGIIFTGGFEDFGFWQKNENCVLVYHSLAGLTAMRENDEIWRIYKANGHIYFQSFTAIYIYNYETITVLEAPFVMLFLHLVNQRFIAQIIDHGLYWFADNKFSFIEGSHIFNQSKVHSIIPYKNNKYLIATSNQGLYVFDGKGFENFNSEASDFLKFYTCNTALKVNDSVFVFGSILNGLIVTDQDGKILMHYNKSNGLKNNTILSLFKDSDKGLWVGKDDGVSYIELNSPFTHYTSSGGALGTIYSAIRSGNEIYLGTNHGLFVADIDETSGIFNFSNLRFINNSQGHVWSLYKYDNQIFCGHNEGTFLVKGSSLEKISDITGGWSLRPFGQYLIQGTYTGIVVYEKNENGKWSFKHKVEGFGEPIRHIEVDYLGYLWASHHQKGLYKIELNSALDSVESIKFYDNLEDVKSNLNVFELNRRIVFTNGQRLFTYDYVQNSIVPVYRLNEDLGNFSQSRKIIPFEISPGIKDPFREEKVQLSHYFPDFNKFLHDQTLYWFVFDNKFALFQINTDFSAKKILELRQRSEGLPTSDMTLLMLDASTLLIPNRECFDLYNLNLHQPVSQTNRLTIDKIKFFGKGQSISFCYGTTEIWPPWFTNNLTIYFSDPSMFSQEERIFFYRIPEIDERWNITTTDNFTYLNLKHGSYTIEIKRELLSQDIHTFDFTIRTPWYLSVYAIIGYILAFGGLVLLAHRIVKFEIKRQKELVQMGISHDSIASELDFKNYELTLTIRYLIEKNEILTNLHQEIIDIKENSSKYPVKNLKNMERIIAEGLYNQTDDWKKAMNNLKLTQQGFFKKLTDRYPDLTTNDLRLCSYLRMNFSTKEIARLLNISTRAVEISRYRLRKKMNLSHDINLAEFLMSESFSEKNSSV